MAQLRFSKIPVQVLVLAGAPGLLAPGVVHARADVKVCVEVTLRAPEERPKPAAPQRREDQAPEDDAQEPASQPTSQTPGEPPPLPQTDGHGEPPDQDRDRLSGVPVQAPSPTAGPRPSQQQKEASSQLQVDRSLLPRGQTPDVYLKRLFEHFVTHQEGFVAVDKGCRERIRVELYPLREGWTAFTRYSGHGREERVDRLYADELSQFAERAVLALLGNRPISSTIMRDTVLRADSKRVTRRIRGTHHFLIELGTQLRGGNLPTASDDGGASAEVRLFSPMTLSAGYRARFESWGLEAMSHFGISTSKTSIRENRLGGHVDLGGLFGVNLHFLRYTNPRGLTSFYFGGGSTFELLWFSVIRPEVQRTDDDRSTLFSGGLTVDAVCGFEFLRASTVQFLLQGELNLPAYEAHTENEDGGLRSWLPGVTVKLGMMF